jgi:hypothetical protein
MSDYVADYAADLPWPIPQKTVWVVEGAIVAEPETEHEGLARSVANLKALLRYGPAAGLEAAINAIGRFGGTVEDSLEVEARDALDEALEGGAGREPETSEAQTMALVAHIEKGTIEIDVELITPMDRKEIYDRYADRSAGQVAYGMASDGSPILALVDAGGKTMGPLGMMTGFDIDSSEPRSQSSYVLLKNQCEWTGFTKSKYYGRNGSSVNAGQLLSTLARLEAK